METLHPRCAGLDVHKDTVVACARVHLGKRPTYETRTFGTTTAQLHVLAAWLASFQITHVVMESTGVYWKPVWHVLEADFDLMLANAGHVKAVPGRKTDVKDAEWLSDLLAHGLVRGSFIAERPIQELRDLTRTRKQLVEEKSRHTQRIQKALQDANVKLSSVVTDILGATGRSVIEAIIAGEEQPKKLLELKNSRIKASDDDFLEALEGSVTDHHRFLLRLHLDQIRRLESSIQSIDHRIDKLMEPYQAERELLETIPGISSVLSNVIISEIGTDMSAFPSAAHLISWAGLCPRNDESAGKRRSTRLRHGGTWLKPQLIQTAWSAAQKKDSYPRSLYYRLRARRGPKKAVVAVAASLLTSIYHMLKRKEAYRDLGPTHFDKLSKMKAVGRLVDRLNGLGFDVRITPRDDAA